MTAAPTTTAILPVNHGYKCVARAYGSVADYSPHAIDTADGADRRSADGLRK